MIPWDWEPSIVIGCAALVLGYLAIARRYGRNRIGFWMAGVALLLFDLVSPLDTLADSYLFSAHIVQHFLLALVIPPLLLLGTPRGFAEAALRRPAIGKIEGALGHPPISWLLGVGTMLIWHVPAFFYAALANDSLHVFQHLSFLVTGTIFWWPIAGPLQDRRLPTLGAVSYLFSACLSCGLLGAFLTFGPVGLYPAYLHSPQPGIWGLDPKSDQQLGGLLMWIPGCFVYLSAILWKVRSWYGAPESRELTRERTA